MNKTCTLTIALIVASLCPVSAHAAPVTVTLTGGSWGLGAGWASACLEKGCDPTNTALNVTWSVADGLDTSFVLNAEGASQSILFGSGLLREEDNLIGDREIDGLGLTARLEISSPEVPLEDNVATILATVGELKDNGEGSGNVDLSVRFAPVWLPFSDGGELRIDLSPMTWNCQAKGACMFGSDQIQDSQFTRATFTLTKEVPVSLAAVAPIAVPEPSSIFLLSIGLAGMGLRLRRRC